MVCQNRSAIDKNIIIFDTEFTAWEGSAQRSWSGPNEYRELIQIAAIKLDPSTLDEVAQPFDILIKPTINPELSDYISALTGISNEIIASNGYDLESALQLFNQYTIHSSLYSFGNDCHILNENITLKTLNDRFAPYSGYNLRQWFKDQNIELNALHKGEAICSGNLASYVGSNFNTEAHNALNDVNSIRYAILHLMNKFGAPSPFL